MPASYCGLADTMEFTSRSGAVRHRTALAKSRSLVTGCGSFYYGLRLFLFKTSGQAMADFKALLLGAMKTERAHDCEQSSVLVWYFCVVSRY
jgi:hypothetical protein